LRATTSRQIPIAEAENAWPIGAKDAAVMFSLDAIFEVIGKTAEHDPERLAPLFGKAMLKPSGGQW
jgi:hypothetical protein